MRYLTVEEVLKLHARLIEQSGGSEGLRDPDALASAVEQPRMTFGGEDLYPTLAEKAADLGFALAKNHSFVDGNKRTARAAMEVLGLASEFVEVRSEIESRARACDRTGIDPVDALHLGSAAEAEADVLCATDDQFLRRGQEVDTGATRVLTPVGLIDHIESRAYRSSRSTS